VTTRRARWLTDRTLLLVDEELCDPAGYDEVDGRTALGRGVTERAIRSLRALRPLIAEEPPAPHEGWIRLGASSRPSAALRAAGVDVRDARVVWFRADALVAHGRPARAVRREPGGLSVSVGLETWRVRPGGVVSEAAALTGSEALLVINPLDDSTPLPIVAHHRRASRDRVRRVASRRRQSVAPRPPAAGEPERIARDIASAGAPDEEGPTELGSAVLVTHALPPGGAERQWVYLAQGLHREGVDARLVTTHAVIGRDAHYVPMLAASDVPVLELPDLDPGTLLEGVAGADLLSEVQSQETELSDVSLRLTSALRTMAPDAVIAQLDGSNITAGLAGVRAGVPNVVMSFRNYNPDNFSYLRTDWYRSSYRALAERPEVILSGNSRAGNDDYAEWIGVSPDRVHEVPNGVSAGAISMDVRAGGADRLRNDLGLGPDEPVVLGVFRLSEEKRPALFVEACARAAARIPRLRVLIAGVGPLEGEVRRLGDLYGLGDSLRMLGARRDVADLLELADLLLMTSRFEGMPNVVLEAQISAVPVVAPALGAVPEIVVDGETGIVIEGDQAVAFADAIVEVLADPAAWSRRCVARHDALAEEFSVEQMVARYRALAVRASAGAALGAGG
jgi:glycosyltransferase involved in cell wall biosynthesis